MNKFRRLIVVIIIFEILTIGIFNYFLLYKDGGSKDRLYKVEAHRIYNEIKNKDEYAKNPEKIDLSKYDAIIKVSKFANDSTDNDYIVKEYNGVYYQIEYRSDISNKEVILINGILIVVALFITGILIYIYLKVIKPFYNMSNMTYELAKGNLTNPIKEEKSKFFGKFLWGMDMLREKLESNKQEELRYQKEKKTLLLSLSHDIKTPLSAIDLYTKALKENLYDTEEKRVEALDGISCNVTTIKNYVNEIHKISREEFLNLEVKDQEVYLKDVIEDISKYYKEKLGLLHTNFIIDEYNNILLKGDRDRIVEVIQNIIENAIKYGDGKEVGISFSEEEDYKLISIRNSGNTLDESLIPNIFDSFYRGDNTDNIQGNGLGLYICKNLMKNMGGDIYAEVANENFIVTIVVKIA